MYRVVLRAALMAVALWASTTGAHAWLASQTQAVTFDSSGNVYRTGIGMKGWDTSWVVAKYDTRGRQLWQYVLKQRNPLNWPHYITVSQAKGQNPCVYVAAQINRTTYLSDDTWTAVLKLDAATGAASPSWPDTGEGVGVRLYHGPGFIDTAGHLLYRNQTRGMGVDSAGNVYVACKSPSNGLPYATVLRYDWGGTLVWEKREPMLTDIAGLACDEAHGRVYVLGSAPAGVICAAYAIGDPASEPAAVWSAASGGQGAAAGLRSLAVDASGCVYAAGWAPATVGLDTWARIYVVKYNPDGTTAWTSGDYASPSAGDHTNSLLALDGNGGAVVTYWAWSGTAWAEGVGHIMATMRFASGGTQAWTVSASSMTEGKGMAVDPVRSSVWVTGDSLTTDIQTLCFDLGTGARKWTNTYNNAVEVEYGICVALDSAGNGVVGGISGNQDRAAVTMLISPAGVTKWVNLKKGW